MLLLPVPLPPVRAMLFLKTRSALTRLAWAREWKDLIAHFCSEQLSS
jgi:hypothetical protein